MLFELMIFDVIHVNVYVFYSGVRTCHQYLCFRNQISFKKS